MRRSPAVYSLTALGTPPPHRSAGAIEPRASPDLLRLLHEQHTVEIGVESVRLTDVVHQWKFVAIVVAEVHVPRWVGDLLEGEHIAGVVVPTAAIEVEDESLRLVDISKDRGERCRLRD